MTTVNSLGAQELAYLSGMSATQGYQVLNGNMAKAVTNFEKTPQTQSDITYFEQNIDKVKTVSDFLSNTRLVDFVLSAYGLDSEDNYQGLVKAVLTQDPNASGSLVNQLSDPRFKQMATALDFYDNGLGALQAVGMPEPTTASSAEGVTLTSTTSATAAGVASTGPAYTTTTSINSSISPSITISTSGSQYMVLQEAAGTATSIGITVSGSQYLPVDEPGAATPNVSLSLSGNQYFQVTEPDGSTTGYTQAGVISVNSNNLLALSDGSVVQPPITVPSGTTSLSVDASGNVFALASGQTTPAQIGQLQTASFTDNTQLTTDSNGYYTPTAASGSATLGTPTGTVSASGISSYTQAGYFSLNSSNQLALPDGTLLVPQVTFPSDTTGISIDSSGNIYAQETGQTTTTLVGQLQLANFSDTTTLSADSAGYDVYTAPTGSTAAATAPSFAASAPASTYGPTVYAQSGSFTLNSAGQLTASNGAILQPSVIFPSDTTSVTITSDGVIEANELGQTTPTVLAQLQTASFSDSSGLSHDSLGYYTATSASGAATVSNSASSVTTSGVTSNLVTTVTQTTANSGSSAFHVGIGVSGSDYLILQKADGTTAYAKSAYFSINSANQLALSDGSLLYPPVILPPGTTAVTVTSSGQLYAQVTGSTTPTSVGELETAKFANPQQLSEDKNGYYTPTSASGTATTGFQSGSSFVFSSTIQSLVNNYVQNEFEIAVGQENSGVREALYFQRSIGPDETSVATYNTATKADVILGDSVLVNVAETVLGEPAQIAYQSINSQEHLIESGLQLNNLTNTKYIASLTARYLALYDASNSSSSEASSSPALQILSAFGSGSSDSSSSSSSAASSILSLAV